MKYLIRAVYLDKHNNFIMGFDQDIKDNDSIKNAMRRFGNRIERDFRNNQNYETATVTIIEVR